jgi:hypothetical protein
MDSRELLIKYRDKKEKYLSKMMELSINRSFGATGVGMQMLEEEMENIEKDLNAYARLFIERFYI